jgi:uncharacterized protein YoxC
MLWEISLLIIAIAFLIVVIFAIPALLQIRRTAKNMEITAKTLNQNLPGILTNVDEISTNLSQITQSIHYQVNGVRNVVDKFQKMADDVVDFEQNLREEIESPLMQAISTISAFTKGARAFTEALRRRK